MRDIWKKENNQNSETYDRLAKEHGSGHRAADWGSVQSQELRFRILSECGLGMGDSVLDVGCGIGDFHGWLKQRGYKGAYTGVDIAPQAVRIARSKYPKASFRTGDIADKEVLAGEKHEVVVASGIFAKRPESGQEYLEAMIMRMFACCRRAVAFNSLSAWAADAEGGEFYADPSKTLDFCRTLTPWLALRTDYHPRDFTIYLYKKRT